MPTTKSLSPRHEARSEATGTLLSPRHEAFCQYFVLCGNATYAAASAGYAPRSAHNQGYRLTGRADTRARIADIRRSLARAYCLDAGVLLGKLEAVYQCAIEDHSLHAAARAVEIQSRIARQMMPRGGERSDRDQPRGEDGPSFDKLRMRPDRDTDMMTNDDKFRSQADGFVANSIPCAASGRRK